MANRKLKMRDTFTKVFPSYTHGEPTCLTTTASHFFHQYGPKNDETDEPLHVINRAHTHKLDFMKEYHESMLKISNMYEMKRKA